MACCSINSSMTDEPFDQLKALEADALTDQYSNHVLLTGLDQMRAHQRGKKVGKAIKKPVPKKRASRLAVPKHERKPTKKRGAKQTIPESVIEAIRQQDGPMARVAKMFGVSSTTVSKVRSGAYDK